MSPDYARSRASPLRERVSQAIVDAAGRVIASDGPEASMSDIAAAAGVARATLYRYFPTRAALLAELEDVVICQLAERLAAARLDAVDPLVGVVRAVRALVEAGEAFGVVAGRHALSPSTLFEAEVREPLRRLLERAQAAGAARSDVSSTFLADALIGLVGAALRSNAELEREDLVAAAADVFILGVRGNEPKARRASGAR